MRRIAFLLIDGYALLSTASALEPLRAANQFSEGIDYDITLLSNTGKTAKSSAGGTFETRFYRDAIPLFDLIFVVAGGDPARISDPALFAWLRQADRNGAALGGISGGAVILAKAGLLEGRRFTVHWHHYDDFDTMPGDWLLERRLFVIDRDRYTCAGGSAPLDMMHAIIARDHGTRFAQRISDWFIQTEIRGSEAPQQASIASRYGTLPEGVEAALELMESHIADPLGQDQIAALSGLSTRQLQRQFKATLGRSIMEEYRRIRLETGKEFAVSTHLSLSEIAQLTGFSTQAHFSDAFRRLYGHAPSKLRSSK
ncbi:GlxA family transcriptional regulator [Celeribacter litoreus]|uniref:GlxA family transcriptional regulator n=1 Tax=Celeribacter litoreus TaxID=2876714 RepID=UPI001CCCBD7C|nr:GlxA family transcriptional regulator [Celeribacter litoreus]MCA0043984.1 GlxA family transcriptional regulator [Celeribacter litoreus]